MVLVLVLAVLAVSYASSMRAYLEQKEHLQALRDSIAESKASIAEMKRERRRWKDPAYQEAQATERLGFVKPGEIAFQVIGEDGDPLDHEDSLTDPADLDVENEPAWWQTAWQTMEAAGNPEDVPDPVEEIDPPKKKSRQ
jgi:cell division protein FtsB